MFIGHIAVGFAAERAASRVSLRVLVGRCKTCEKGGRVRVPPALATATIAKPDPNLM